MISLHACMRRTKSSHLCPRGTMINDKTDLIQLIHSSFTKNKISRLSPSLYVFLELAKTFLELCESCRIHRSQHHHHLHLHYHQTPWSFTALVADYEQSFLCSLFCEKRIRAFVLLFKTVFWKKILNRYILECNFKLSLSKAIF